MTMLDASFNLISWNAFDLFCWSISCKLYHLHSNLISLTFNSDSNLITKNWFSIRKSHILRFQHLLNKFISRWYWQFHFEEAQNEKKTPTRHVARSSHKIVKWMDHQRWRTRQDNQKPIKYQNWFEMASIHWRLMTN